MKRFFSVLLLFSIFSVPALAIDIAVYGDVRSWCIQKEGTFHRWPSYQPNCNLEQMLANFDNEDSLWYWYNQMGVTHVQVYYQNAADYSAIPPDAGNIKVLNNNWPGESFKYLDCQNRDFHPAEEIEFPWVSQSAWGPNVLRAVPFDGGPTSLGVGPNVIVQGDTSSGEPSPLWLSSYSEGNWNGWDQSWEWNGDNLLCMPMHFRLTYYFQRNDEIHDSIATFRWFQRGVSDRDGTNSGWWSFPPKTITVSDTGNPNEPWFVAWDWHPRDNSGQFQRYTEDAANLLTPLSSIADSIFYGHWTPCRMEVAYHGYHDFYLYRVEVWDEGYHKLIMADSTTKAQTAEYIKNAFVQELYTTSQGKQAGWYYDEWDTANPVSRQLEPMAHVCKLLLDRGLPMLHINGSFGRKRSDNLPVVGTPPLNQFYYWFNQYEARVPTVHMNEFYFTSGRPVDQCIPDSTWYPTDLLPVAHTTTSSDTFYAHFDPSDCGILPICNQQQYKGYKSLQCSLDGWIWDWKPAHYLNGNLAVPFSCNQEPDSQVDCSLLYQTSLVHDHGDYMWALIGGGDDVVDSVETPCCPMRMPSPNECKLAAWLAVGCDVDGIMWYPVGLSAVCLFDWDSAHAVPPGYDPEHVHPGWWCDPNKSIHPNQRYFAAQKVCREIRDTIAPILESLEFKGTLASRRYMQNYGTAENPQVILRTVSQPLPPCYRSEEPIYSYLDFIKTSYSIAPDTTPELVEVEEPENYRFVQVSRWENFGNNEEDFWFLIINRRALDNETRTVTLGVSNVQEPDSLYMVDEMISGQTHAAIPYLGPYGMTGRSFSVTLAPGDAELVHYHLSNSHDSREVWVNGVSVRRADSTSIILHWLEVTQNEDGQAFTTYYYTIIGSDSCDQGYSAVACTPDHYFIDRSMLATHSKHFYQVKAIGFLQPLTSATIAAGTKTKTKIRKQVRI